MSEAARITADDEQPPEALAEKRELLEDVAEMDVPASQIAEKLLAVLEGARNVDR